MGGYKEGEEDKKRPPATCGLGARRAEATGRSRGVCECGINVCMNVFYRCNNSYSDNWASGDSVTHNPYSPTHTHKHTHTHRVSSLYTLHLNVKEIFEKCNFSWKGIPRFFMSFFLLDCKSYLGGLH